MPDAGCTCGGLSLFSGAVIIVPVVTVIGPVVGVFILGAKVTGSMSDSVAIINTLADMDSGTSPPRMMETRGGSKCVSGKNCGPRWTQ